MAAGGIIPAIDPANLQAHQVHCAPAGMPNDRSGGHPTAQDFPPPDPPAADLPSVSAVSARMDAIPAFARHNPHRRGSISSAAAGSSHA